MTEIETDKAPELYDPVEEWHKAHELDGFYVVLLPGGVRRCVEVRLNSAYEILVEKKKGDYSSYLGDARELQKTAQEWIKLTPEFLKYVNGYMVHTSLDQRNLEYEQRKVRAEQILKDMNNARFGR
jgi:hypothetical protein